LASTDGTEREPGEVGEAVTVAFLHEKRPAASA